MVENNTNNAKNERIFDAMLKIVADEALREEMDALPSDEELLKLYPDVESLNKKAYAVINREFRTLRRKKALRMFAQAAAIFCIALVLSAGVLMAHTSSRNFILNLLIDIQHDHVAFDFEFGDTQSANERAFDFDYVPDGFFLSNRQILESMITYIFENADGDIIFMRRFLGYSFAVGVDTDYADFSEIQLATGIAHISKAVYENDFSTIMWVHGEDVVSITATLDTNALIELAEHYMAR